MRSVLFLCSLSTSLFYNIFFFSSSAASGHIAILTNALLSSNLRAPLHSCYVNWMASWDKGTNFCSWRGIKCEKITGHMISLNLYCNKLWRAVSSNSSLFVLRHLQVLDLSYNDFRGSPMLPQFGQFKNLTDLELQRSCSFRILPSF